MKLDQARALFKALEKAIAEARLSGSDEVDLQSHLSANLGKALDELEAAIAKARDG